MSFMLYFVEWESNANYYFLFNLVILGNNIEFERAVLQLSENLTFDVDACVNLFEVNLGFGLHS